MPLEKLVNKQVASNHSILVGIIICHLVLLVISLAGCQRPPPDHRPLQSLTDVPPYEQGDAKRGKQIYAEACGQCHKLTAGNNEKGPQLMNIYGSSAGLLKDYKYSQALKQSGWVWNAETLDKYIADSQQVLPNGRMLTDPMPDKAERADVIAYISTLRQEVPTTVDTNQKAKAE